jgi:uncharacterized protein YodC (DUF2158 family)
MAQSKFKLGDIVTLKSGGPKMTIYNIITMTDAFFGEAPRELEINIINVRWFNDKNEVVNAEFPEHQLVLAE